MKNCSQLMLFYTNNITEIFKKLDNSSKTQENNFTGCADLVKDFGKKMVNKCGSTISELTERRYDGLSFFGGMLFVAAIAILSFFGLYYWKKQRSPNLPDYNYF